MRWNKPENWLKIGNRKMNSLCPICKREVTAPADAPGSDFPFCSDRCKLIDLGRWLSGKYQIPVIDPDEAHDGKVEDPAAAEDK